MSAAAIDEIDHDISYCTNCKLVSIRKRICSYCKKQQ